MGGDGGPGGAGGEGAGGGIYNLDATLTVSHSTFTGNRAAGSAVAGAGAFRRLLLAISQRFRFQEKSFPKFLLSKETDLDSFR